MRFEQLNQRILFSIKCAVALKKIFFLMYLQCLIIISLSLMLVPIILIYIAARAYIILFVLMRIVHFVCFSSGKWGRACWCYRYANFSLSSKLVFVLTHSVFHAWPVVVQRLHRDTALFACGGRKLLSIQSINLSHELGLSWHAHVIVSLILEEDIDSCS